MQLQHLAAAAAPLVVQSIHILRNDKVYPTHLLQAGQAIMCSIGCYMGKFMPAGKAPGPVPERDDPHQSCKTCTTPAGLTEGNVSFSNSASANYPLTVHQSITMIMTVTADP
jgi:hypothetical protein